MIQNGNSNITVTANGNTAIYYQGAQKVQINASGINLTGGILVSTYVNSSTVTATSTVTAGSFLVSGISTGVTALGTAYANAYFVTKGYTIITTVTSTNNGVALGSGTYPGLQLTITNATANAANVWPYLATGKINNLGAGVPYVLSGNTTQTFYCAATGATSWFYTLGPN